MWLSLLSVRAQSLSCDRLFLTPRTIPRLLYPWDFSGKNTGLSCHFLLQDNLPDPGIKPASPVSPAWAGGFLTIEPPGKPMLFPLRATGFSASPSPALYHYWLDLNIPYYYLDILREAYLETRDSGPHHLWTPLCYPTPTIVVPLPRLRYKNLTNAHLPGLSESRGCFWVTLISQKKTAPAIYSVSIYICWVNQWMNNWMDGLVLLGGSEWSLLTEILMLEGV